MGEETTALGSLGHPKAEDRRGPEAGALARPTGTALFWLAIIALSGAGSIAAVRAATPLTLDERFTSVVLFLILPGLIIFVLGRIFRPLGIFVAAALPFVWLAVSRDSADSHLLWLLPVVAAVLILAVARLSSARRLQRAPAVAAVLAFALALLLPSHNRPVEGLRLLLIGWDGATWRIIDPMIDEGGMPNLERLLESGHRARLRSLPSLFSPQVWTTVCTGCLPEVHGIMGWTNRKSDFPVGRIWDQLKLEGRSFGLCDWYFTWPPDPGDEKRDFILPSHLAPDHLTFPEDYSFFRAIENLERSHEGRSDIYGVRLVARLGLDAWRHGVRVSTLRRASAEVVWRKLGKRNKLDCNWRNRWIYTAVESDLLAELLRTRRPEFAAALFTQIDGVCHAFWKYMEPEKFPEVTPEDIARYGEVIHEVYAEADRGLEKILEFVPPEADVIIVSDHGFEALGNRIAGKSCRIRPLKLLRALGVEGKMFGTIVGADVYLWALADTKEEKEAILAAVEPVLRGARLEGEETPFFSVSRMDESIKIDIAPRTTLPAESSVVFGERPARLRGLLRATRDPRISGGHAPDGIYLLSGPSASRAVSADSLHVVDVAPTMAAILGLPASPLWTGRPALEGAYLPPASAGDYPPPGGTGEEPERISKELIERLRALGYLD
jgi:hypothetical protein